MNSLPPTTSRLFRHRWLLIGTGTTLALVVGLACVGLGEGQSAGRSAAAALYALLTAGPLALAYLLAGVGLGWPIARWLVPASPHRAWHQIGLGLAAMLWLSHVLGMLGLLSGPKGQWIGLGVVVAGLAVLGVQIAAHLRGKPPLPTLPAAALVGMPGVAVMLIAACSPPGWLWGSEAGGYDVLEYHLELAQEWAGGPRLWPLEHNVYSYFPSYFEAAFTHIAAIMGAGSSRASGLLTPDGTGALACQLLHAFTAVGAAALTGRLTWVLARRAGLAQGASLVGGGLAGGAVACLPWMVVVGSMAYNEAAATMLGAGALLAVVDRGCPAWRRGALVGLLLGAATACKPTALFVIGPAAALLMLAEMRPREWAGALAAACLAGLVMLGPPALRNTLASGNPVFPAATGLFGTGHWTAEQAARFAAGHRAEGSIADRVGLLFATAADPRQSVDAQPRGIFQQQWALFFPAAALACAAASLWKPLRRPLVVLGAGVVAACAWWVAFSHCQSRFLVPLICPLATFLGLATAVILTPQTTHDTEETSPPGWLRTIGVVLGCVPLLLGGKSLQLFMFERGGRPNATLADGGGVGVRTGEAYREDLSRATPREREAYFQAAGAEAYANLALPPGATVLLVGEARAFYFTGRVVYNTTWDSSILGAAMAQSGNDPEAWSRAVSARGIEYVVVDFVEAARLMQSRWFDPAITMLRLQLWVDEGLDRVYPDPYEEGLAPRGVYRVRTPKGSGST